MQIYLDCYGANTVIKGVAISCSIFYLDVPETFENFLLNSITTTLLDTKQGSKRFYTKIKSYDDYFHNKTILIENVEGLDRYIKIRSAISKLLYTTIFSVGQLANNVEIFSSNNIPTFSFENININKSSKHLIGGLNLTYHYARECWKNYIHKLNLIYPEYKLNKSLGSMTLQHANSIINNQLTIYHTKDSLEQLAYLLYKELVTYLNSDVLTYKDLVKKLPIWWVLTEDNKYKTLLDYYTSSEQKEFIYNFKLCKEYIKADFYTKLLLPCIRPFSTSFNKFLKENPID